MDGRRLASAGPPACRLQLKWQCSYCSYDLGSRQRFDMRKHGERRHGERRAKGPEPRFVPLEEEETEPRSASGPGAVAVRSRPVRRGEGAAARGRRAAAVAGVPCTGALGMHGLAPAAAADPALLRGRPPSHPPEAPAPSSPCRGCQLRPQTPCRRLPLRQGRQLRPQAPCR